MNNYEYAELEKNIEELRGFTRNSLQMRGYDTPISITENEFNWIINFLKEKQYETCYECATAFGISSSAIALGIKETENPKITTIDACVEEKYQNSGNYRQDKGIYDDECFGLQVAKKIWNYYGVEHMIESHIARSPDNVAQILGETRLDFAFIDAYHNDEALCEDIFAIKPFLKQKSSVLIHDRHTFGRGTIDEIALNLGKTYREITELDRGYSFGLGLFE